MLARVKSWLDTVSYWTEQYGPIDGPRIAVRLKLGDHSRKPFTLTLPDFPAPIWLRGGTVDTRVFFHVLAAKEYDISDTAQGKELRRRYDALIASGAQPLIIDCGANIGLSGIWYARQFPEAEIIAVEPDQSNLEIAFKNLAAYPNVRLVNGGVWNTPSPLFIVNPDADAWAFRVEEGEGTIVGFTIDQLSQGRPILIVKIDIEGAEKALFRSNIGWIDRTDLIAIELHDWLFPKAGTSQPFMRAIAGHPHEVAMRGENLFFLMSGER
ncbi:FkbM family methyltransferase [Bradyrhizobium sp. 200]|uniref:FkbM family methyltransferase n=1 Tax=Bradyrhizobium sp. 200 TaxID=2782665 RepID=UPI001FFF7E2D|nr:FkbM family methyltransferase [Bradyrhizobium sp. 200]UPJ51746.1 FkbM family methyltransferase [Bradyrhizobium sp. 200]